MGDEQYRGTVSGIESLEGSGNKKIPGQNERVQKVGSEGCLVLRRDT